MVMYTVTIQGRLKSKLIKEKIPPRPFFTRTFLILSSV